MSIATLTPAAAAALAEHARMLRSLRDDGPLAIALGRLTRASGPPAILLALLALLPLVAAIVIGGGDASQPLVAAAVGWAVLAGGLSSGRPLTDRMRWAVPPVLRALELAGLIWVAAVAGSADPPAVFALLCAIAYHHYDVVYGQRHRGVSPPRWAQLAGGGWDGRLLLACAALLAGAVPAAFYVAAAVLAVLFVGVTVVEWRRVGQAEAPDDTDDDDEEDQAP
jgi:hypothetical protein